VHSQSDSRIRRGFLPAGEIEPHHAWRRLEHRRDCTCAFPQACALSVPIERDLREPCNCGDRIGRPKKAQRRRAGLLWFEPSFDQVFAGHTELLLLWRSTHRGPDQTAKEYGSENRHGDFVQFHWFKRPHATLKQKTPADCSAGNLVSLSFRRGARRSNYRL